MWSWNGLFNDLVKKERSLLLPRILKKEHKEYKYRTVVSELAYFVDNLIKNTFALGGAGLRNISVDGEPKEGKSYKFFKHLKNKK